MSRLSLILLIVLSTPVFAGPYAYECEILEELWLQDDGSLKQFHKLYYKNTFLVDRETGLVLGGSLGNSAYPTKQIIDPGGKEHNFKMVWISKPLTGTNEGRNAIYLSVQEFNENEKKPFTIVVNDIVLSGVCN